MPAQTVEVHPLRRSQIADRLAVIEADVRLTLDMARAERVADPCAVCDGRGNDPHEPGLLCAVCERCESVRGV